MLQYKDLLEVCISALNKFNSEKQSVEEYIKAFIKNQKGLDNDDHTFLVEIFSGCVRYAKLLQVVVEGFYVSDGKTSLRVDNNLYKILCYMVIFRLDELGLSHFNKFINSQDVNKMHRFLNFFLNDKNLSTWIYDEWCKLYDTLFVDEELMKPLQRWKDDLDAVVSRLEDTIYHRIKPQFEKKTPTRPKSFNLTKPKPKSVPLPDRLPKAAKCKPIPKTIFKEPKEFALIEKVKDENHMRAEQKLLDANEDQFTCAHAEKSFRTQIKINKIREAENRKLEFNKKHKRNTPPNLTENRPIKLNAAAVLREGALFQKKEKQELQKLENLLSGAKDESEFVEWQTSMHQQDKDKKLIEMEQRRVMGKLSREEAILARQNQVKSNQETVSQLRFESAKMMQDYLTLRLEEEKQMRTLVEQIIEGHQNAQDAKVKLVEYKRKIVHEVNAESREMMRRALEEAEEEMKRRSRLIQEIRAMESIPVNRQKLVDLTSTAGHALLSEMSIVELHERLSLLKEQEQKDMDEKKDLILQQKQAKNEAIMETIARISTHRHEITKAAKVKSEEKLRMQKVQEEKVKQNKELNELQERLQQRKEERIKGSKELALKPDAKSATRTKGLIRQKKQLEKTRWRQLEMGQQRMAETRIKSSQGRFDGRDINSNVATLKVA